MKKLTLTLIVALAPGFAAADVYDKINPQPSISYETTGPASWQLTVWRQAYRAGGLTTLPVPMTIEACEIAAKRFVASSEPGNYYGLEAYCTDARTGEVVFFTKDS